MPDLLENRQRLAWLLLGLVMVASSVFVLIEGRFDSFSGDELYYYAHLTAQDTTPVHATGLEYFLAPHNGHMVVLGRLIYEVLFTLAGTDYVVFRIAEIVGVLVTVALLFRLASKRIDPLLAVAPCMLLLFLGYAWETLLWPFNLHTVYALAFGLAAVLALEREDRRGDIFACLLLVCSVATVEVGLAFVAGVAVAVLLRGDRWGRIWIVLVPAVLYGIWWLWARKFDQPAVVLSNVHLIPIDLTNALAAVLGSLTGLNPTGPTVAPETTGVTAWASVLAGAAVLGLAVRTWRGRVPIWIWLVVATIVAYWISIALGARPPDSSRYIFVGAVLVILAMSIALQGVRLPAAVPVVVGVVALLALAPNLAKFYDGRRILINDARATKAEFAMFDLSRDRVDPEFIPAADPRVQEVGGAVITPLSARSYFRGASDYGPLAYSLAQLREQEPAFRTIADATLVAALRLVLEPAAAPAGRDGCSTVDEATPEAPLAFELPPGGTLIESASGQPLEVRLRRFEDNGAGTVVGKLGGGEWGGLEITRDAAPEPWSAVVDSPAVFCPLG